jgi:hypothetical protein
MCHNKNQCSRDRGQVRKAALGVEIEERYAYCSYYAAGSKKTEIDYLKGISFQHYGVLV